MRKLQISDTARALLITLVVLAVSACSSIAKNPSVPGQFGQIQSGNQKVTGYLIQVYSPSTKECTYNDIAEWKSEGGYHSFLFTPGYWSSPSSAHIECKIDENPKLERSFQVPFDVETFRATRTASTVTSLIVSGPIALITGPLVSEATKSSFHYPPILVHMPSTAELSTKESREIAREEAVLRWQKLSDQLKIECNGKTKSNRNIVIGYACRQSFFAELRDVDLSIFAK